MPKYVQVQIFKSENSGLTKYRNELYKVGDFEVETIRSMSFYNNDFANFTMLEGTLRILSDKPPVEFDIFPCTYRKTVIYGEKLTCKEVKDLLKGNPKYFEVLSAIDNAVSSFAANLYPKDEKGNIDYTKTNEIERINSQCLSNRDFNKQYYVSLCANDKFKLENSVTHDNRILIQDFDYKKEPKFDRSLVASQTQDYNSFVANNANNYWLLTVVGKYIKFLIDARENYVHVENLLRDFPFEFALAKQFTNELESFEKAIYFWVYLNNPDEEVKEFVNYFQRCMVTKIKARRGEVETTIRANKEVLDADLQKKDKLSEKVFSALDVKVKSRNNQPNSDFNDYDNTTYQDVEHIIDEVESKIIAQNHVVEAVVTNCLANQKIIDSNDRDFISSQKVSILLDGPTGTGKTAICKAVGDKLGVIVYRTSINAYSATGYKGRNLTQILIDLWNLSDGNLELAQRSIVCLDEFDKLGFNVANISSMNGEIQRELLTFVEGGKYTICIGGEGNPDRKEITFDTSNLTFIAMGAFTEIRNKKESENNKQNKAVGFANYQTKSTTNKFSYEVTEQDYIDFGLERELMGRFNLLISTNPLLKEDLKKILLNSTISPLKTFSDFCAMQGKEVKYDDTFIDEVCLVAEQMGFGARGLHKLIMDVKNKLLLTIMTSQDKEVALTVDLLNTNKHGKKVMGR